MSTTTTNYGLTKPALTDSPPDITVLNGNFDIIDNLLKALSDKFFIADSNTTAAQIEAAYLAGRKIMAIINGVLYPSMIRNGENNYIFATEVPTGDNNANTSMLYRKITSSGWDSTPYQRNLALADHTHSYLPLSGGTLTGPLGLSGAPLADLHAATKKYVDDSMVFKAIYGTTQKAEIDAAYAAGRTIIIEFKPPDTDGLYYAHLVWAKMADESAYRFVCIRHAGSQIVFYDWRLQSTNTWALYKGYIDITMEQVHW